MAAKFEYYNAGDDGQAGNIREDNWEGQSFTPSISHKIKGVKLLVFRFGSPGTITVSIKITDENSHPSGDDLCSGTTNGDTLPTGSPFEWREITLGAGYDLLKNTKYAIVIRALEGDASNYLYLRMDTSSPTYTGGCRETSINGGSSWSSSAQDFMFEEWGELTSPLPVHFRQ